MTNSITQIITHSFLLALAFGTQLYSPVVNTRLTGVGFFKLGTSIVLGALVLALGVSLSMQPTPDQKVLSIYGALILLNVVTFLFHRDQKSLLMWIIYGVQIVLFTTLTFYTFQFQPLWINFFL